MLGLMFVMIEDVTPRSQKRSFFIGKLQADQTVYPRYEIWCKCDNEREAIDRVMEMNQVFKGR